MAAVEPLAAAAAAEARERLCALDRCVPDTTPGRGVMNRRLQAARKAVPKLAGRIGGLAALASCVRDEGTTATGGRNHCSRANAEEGLTCCAVH